MSVVILDKLQRGFPIKVTSFKKYIFEWIFYTFGTKRLFHNLFYFSIQSLQRDFEDWVQSLFN